MAQFTCTQGCKLEGRFFRPGLVYDLEPAFAEKYPRHFAEPSSAPKSEADQAAARAADEAAAANARGQEKHLAALAYRREAAQVAEAALRQAEAERLARQLQAVTGPGPVVVPAVHPAVHPGVESTPGSQPGGARTLAQQQAGERAQAEARERAVGDLAELQQQLQAATAPPEGPGRAQAAQDGPRRSQDRAQAQERPAPHLRGPRQ